MRLATWNVNSIRTRVDRVVAFLERSGTDVLAMQETKCRDEQFPALAFEAAGYEVVHHGLNQWNGVAVASRVGISDVEVGFPGMPTWGDPAAAEARALGVTCDGVRVWSLYVPNGRAVGDPHYVYKLEWMAALRDAAGAWLTDDPDAQIALVGDWNIAPRDEDVWDISLFTGATHVSEPERAAFRALEDVGFTEVTRQHVEQYTYWDYQQLRFPRNEGMRIDFVQASPELAAHVVGAQIDRDERKGKAPSDHVPVIVDLG
ncbi:exodeoxyribonuclease III [Georgenia thermotolerans]|uniref:Exodeoxyribonuclease III n=1 Tax=Georgenia thermotolerans TaxID=527326 RepID=A0A7J5URW9_9MICO|nr:exodeoxyribonuclease III [Georgenia thermotolerans]KAE8765195.1 exodeoxyribonuclease III [Georgenia thermotolerans]